MVSGLVSSAFKVNSRFPLVEQEEYINFIAQDRYDDNYYEDNDYEHKSNQRKGSKKYKDKSSTSGNSLIELLKNQKQLGAGLLGLGLLFTVMGMMLFFEGNLLRLGNICIIAGVFLLIGPSKVSGFFLKESRMQATIITSIGIIFVFMGKPKLGLLIEIFGLLNLFGNMFPVLLALGKNIPILGDIISAFDGTQNKNNRQKRYVPNNENRDNQQYNRNNYEPQF